MAIINNQTTANGDVLYIETTIPAIGVTALIGFVDTTEGEDASVNYTKTFQYSTNGGITWSEWTPLTIANIQAVDVSKFDQLLLRYRYKQKGNGTLEFDENIATGIYENLDCPYYFNESIFKKYFSCNDLEVMRWYINVTEKLYTSELNKYLKFDNGTTGDETDAIAFWQSVAKFFAFYVILARVYRDFYLNEELINNYLLQRGLFTSKYNVLSEYNGLMQNFNNEMRRRGTRAILNEQNDENPYDGELRRYLNLSPDNELTFDYYLPHHCGWWIDRAAPMYRGLEEHLNANSLPYEKYALAGGATATVSTSDPNNVVIRTTGNNQGLNYQGDVDSLINVSRGMNYIFEFEIRVLSANAAMTIGAKCYNKVGVELPNTLVSFKQANTNTQYFVQNLNLSAFAAHPNSWYKIKCVIFNKDKPVFADDVLNIGAGINLKFIDNVDIRKLYPILLINGTTEIRNVYMRPLYTDYERGFLSMNHFVSIWYNSTEDLKLSVGPGPEPPPPDWTGFDYTFDFNVE